MDESTFERFMSYVIKTDDCWLWDGYTNKYGYATFRIEKERFNSHRLMYLHCYGAIPDGCVVRHTCRNGCVNPDHLELGTQYENMADKLRDNTLIRGQSHYNSKLSELQVKEIKNSKLSLSKLAKQFGVAKSTINDIQLGRTWAWLT
jgi:hypothetical protein